MYLWKILKCINGDVAQLVEHLPEEQGVVGSIPTVTTESRINGKPPLPYGSQSVNLVKWGRMLSSRYVSGLKLGKSKW